MLLQSSEYKVVIVLYIQMQVKGIPNNLYPMKVENTIIECSDGRTLSAMTYLPEVLQAAVMIAPATGIKKNFYNAFATYLAENGYGVICFENRGIGNSKQGLIKNDKASLISWGTLDMPGVLNQLKNTFPNTSYHIIGHSAGGQLIGLMENANELSSILNFASSSGSLKNMNYPFKLSAAFFLNVYIPLSNVLFGYTKTQWVGMGEPLPKSVAAQWEKWCNGSGYVKTDFGKEIKKHWYDEITIPSLWMHATDDGIANLPNVKEMVSVYPNSKSKIVTLDPARIGLKEIGHMKFFTRKNRDLWTYALDWLNINKASVTTFY